MRDHTVSFRSCEWEYDREIRLEGSNRRTSPKDNLPLVRVSGIRKNFACGIRNPGLCNPEYSSSNPESHKRLESRNLSNLSSTGKTGIQYVESGIHGVEFRPYLELSFGAFFLSAIDPSQWGL